MKQEPFDEVWSSAVGEMEQSLMVFVFVIASSAYGGFIVDTVVIKRKK